MSIPALKPSTTFPPGLPTSKALGVLPGLKYTDVTSTDTSDNPLRLVAPPLAGAINVDRSWILNVFVGLPVSLTSVAISKSLVLGDDKTG